MADPAAVARVTAEGLAITVRVTPKSSRDAVDGIEERGGKAMLKVRVRAVPEDGKANAAVAEVVARFLDVPRRSVSVTVGLTSREKVVTVHGKGAALLDRLVVRSERHPG